METKEEIRETYLTESDIRKVGESNGAHLICGISIGTLIGGVAGGALRFDASGIFGALLLTGFFVKSVWDIRKYDKLINSWK
ncbi:MAG: hypothetical protein KAJ19_28620, partial [Gammaproteobacteria bacterium]|nr:hypothetical protein [Gammaproteobacteria bacterium]